MGAAKVSDMIGVLKAFYGISPSWRNKKGLKEELIRRLSALSEFEKIMLGIKDG